MTTKVRDAKGAIRFWIAKTNYRCSHAHETQRGGRVCPGGERHQIKLSAPTQKAARKLQYALDQRRDKAADFPGMKPPTITPVASQEPASEPDALTVGAYVADWLQGIEKSQAKGKRGAVRTASTVKRYQSLMAHVSRNVGGLPLASLKPEHIERLYANMRDAGSADKTILNVHRALKHALKDALRKRLITENPADFIDAPGAATYEAQPPTPAETRAIIEAAKGLTIGPLVAVAAWTGARRGELLALTWADVELDADPHIIIRKSKTESGRRRIPLTPGTVARLREYREWQARQRERLGGRWSDADRVFVNAVGNTIDVSTMRRDWARIRARTGLTCRFHDLRHGFATFLLSEGVPAKVASSLLGHSRIAITLDTYSHLIPALGMEADAIKALDAALGG